MITQQITPSNMQVVHNSCNDLAQFYNVLASIMGPAFPQDPAHNYENDIRANRIYDV